MQTNADRRLYYLKDHLGSSIILSSSSGVPLEQISYELYGNSTVTSLLSRYGYTGREMEPVTGLIYYRARWYSPDQGRFISEDPISSQGSINYYSYVYGDPLNYKDPLGLDRQGGKTGRWWEFTDRNFQRWFHKCWKQRGDSDATREMLAEAHSVWIEYGKPDGMNGCGGPPPEPEPALNCDDLCNKARTVVVVGGSAYIAYRCIRFLPSLYPPLWPTIPYNLATP